ncbi:MotA/TolQ/ExbB proton channel family protein [Methyloversatilis discipulorum]|uniref:MotA/TolQ/ExbB proton channel family protein n=1 Tax=Methyloversatilis discipulorum TaxID=1119528 RepID=UPI001A47B697|nr:MotA/TolQ/ExbB proton channel family protein [Methyloversatilis discipulorum]MBL8467988.1 MotA/TolQ/ExbB proton channel family protein [Methyloversatilis discipulorum]
MTSSIEGALYGVSQFFLTPVLVAIAALFLYAFFALGAFVVQALQRRAGQAAGFELNQVVRADPRIGIGELEVIAAQRLECVRIATRVAPLLGLVATMIPMGPALGALGDGDLAAVSGGLGVAFSAVILALIASAMTYAVAQVRRRWYAADLLRIERERAGGAATEPFMHERPHALPAEAVR